MTDDWQDETWEYAQGSEFYEEDQYEDEPREETEEEEETGEGGFFAEEETERGGEGEDIEFAQEYKQLQQIGSERRSTLGTVGLSEGLQKAQRSPEEATLDQVEGVISSMYSEMSETLRQKVITKVEKIKGVYLYNVDVLVLAAIWTVEGKELNKENLETFLTKYKDRADFNPIDLVRYIRTLA